MKHKIICKNCINFLIFKNDICHCDFEHWENIPHQTAILNTPNQFDCVDFEFSIEIQEEIKRLIASKKG